MEGQPRPWLQPQEESGRFAVQLPAAPELLERLTQSLDGGQPVFMRIGSRNLTNGATLTVGTQKYNYTSQPLDRCDLLQVEKGVGGANAKEVAVVKGRLFGEKSLDDARKKMRASSEAQRAAKTQRQTKSLSVKEAQCNGGYVKRTSITRTPPPLSFPGQGPNHAVADRGQRGLTPPLQASNPPAAVVTSKPVARTCGQAVKSLDPPKPASMRPRASAPRRPAPTGKAGPSAVPRESAPKNIPNSHPSWKELDVTPTMRKAAEKKDLQLVLFAMLREHREEGLGMEAILDLVEKAYKPQPHSGRAQILAELSSIADATPRNGHNTYRLKKTLNMAAFIQRLRETCNPPKAIENEGKRQRTQPEPHAAGRNGYISKPGRSMEDMCRGYNSLDDPPPAAHRPSYPASLNSFPSKGQGAAHVRKAMSAGGQAASRGAPGDVVGKEASRQLRPPTPSTSGSVGHRDQQMVGKKRTASPPEPEDAAPAKSMKASTPNTAEQTLPKIKLKGIKFKGMPSKTPPSEVQLQPPVTEVAVETLHEGRPERGEATPQPEHSPKEVPSSASVPIGTGGQAVFKAPSPPSAVSDPDTSGPSVSQKEDLHAQLPPFKVPSPPSGPSLVDAQTRPGDSNAKRGTSPYSSHSDGNLVSRPTGSQEHSRPANSTEDLGVSRRGGGEAVTGTAKRWSPVDSGSTESGPKRGGEAAAGIMARKRSPTDSGSTDSGKPPLPQKPRGGSGRVFGGLHRLNRVVAPEVRDGMQVVSGQMANGRQGSQEPVTTPSNEQPETEDRRDAQKPVGALPVEMRVKLPGLTSPSKAPCNGPAAPTKDYPPSVPQEALQPKEDVKEDVKEDLKEEEDPERGRYAAYLVRPLDDVATLTYTNMPKEARRVQYKKLYPIYRWVDCRVEEYRRTVELLHADWLLANDDETKTRAEADLKRYVVRKGAMCQDWCLALSTLQKILTVLRS